jgi:hypothetical protein
MSAILSAAKSFVFSKGELMNFSILFAVDTSGSTSNLKYYHNIVLKAYNDNKTTHTTILSWNTIGKVITEDQLQALCKAKKGEGMTQIDVIAHQIISSKFIGRLVIVTDGEVSNVDECDRLMQNYKGLTSAEIHIVGKNNLSVSCAFTRSIPFQVFIYDTSTAPMHGVLMSAEKFEVKQKDIQELEELDKIQTLEEFNQKYDNILSALMARTMGSSIQHHDLHNKIVQLKNKLERIIHASSTYLDPPQQVTDATWLSTLEMVKSHLKMNMMEAKEIREKFHILINITKNGLLAKNFSYRLDRVTPLAGVDLDEIEVVTAQMTDMEPFTCPILFNEGVAVIPIIKLDEPLIKSMSCTEIENITNCPLNVLYYESLRSIIKKSFDIPFCFSTLKKSKEEGELITTSPYTRKSILGYIYLGDTEKHIKATNATIAKLLTGEDKCKMLGDVNMWLASMYFIMIEEDINFLRDVIPQLRQQLIKRLNDTKANSSLRGDTVYPSFPTSLGFACWCVLINPYLMPEKDVLLCHIWYFNYLHKICQLLNYYIPDEVLQYAMKRKFALKVLDCCKHDRMPPYIMFKQACVDVTPTCIVPLDGEPTDEQKEKAWSDPLLAEYRPYMTEDEVVELCELVNPSMKGDHIKLMMDWKAKKIVSEVNWPWYHNSTRSDGESITEDDICLSTCRPRVILNNGSSTWREEYSKAFPLVTEQCQIFSGCKYYIAFVAKYSTHPNDENTLLAFIHTHFKNKGIKTLPRDTPSFLTAIINSYRSVAEKIPVKNFIERARESCNLAHRIKLELMENEVFC